MLCGWLGEGWARFWLFLFTHSARTDPFRVEAARRESVLIEFIEELIQVFGDSWTLVFSYISENLEA